jgi:glutathione S-transferase
MISLRQLTHAIFVLLLPLLVAWFGLSAWSALLLVLAALLWRWLIVISGLIAPETHPPIVLETITSSHFAEKARWCLDRLGVEYVERPAAGILGVLFTGRTVPRLNFKTGLVRSSIGHSPEILRFLWGEYGARLGERARFLETSQERLALEKTIDRCGADLQIWVYYHLLRERDITLHLWGANHPGVPRWQRILMRPLYPLTSAFIQRVFAVDDARYAKAVQHVDELLGDIDTRLADGRKSILGGDEINYVDITFAAISGLWLQPQNYGGGMADASLVARERLPAAMQADIERWTEDHPRATAFIRRMYAEERVK